MVRVWNIQTRKEMAVSVPIRGLFNLTINIKMTILNSNISYVSVPIRGLFNLTNQYLFPEYVTELRLRFRPH